MSFKSFIKECAMRFFIIATCVGLANAMLGPTLLPGKTLDFTDFYSAPFTALLATLPSIILYSRKELTLKQTVLRKTLHLLALEGLLTVAAWMSQSIRTPGEILVFMGIVLVVYVVVTLISLWLQNKDAKQINAGLKALQNRN
jgi:hypothetical protein